MKKILLILSVLSTLTIAIPQNGIYGGVGVIIEVPEDTDENGIAAELELGMPIMNNFGVEAKVTKTVEKSTTTLNNFTGTLDITTVALYGTYTFDVTPDIALMPKVGFAYISAKENFSKGGSKFDDTDTNIALGIDAKVHLSPAMDFYMGFTRLNMDFNGESSDINQIAFGIQSAF